MANKTVAAVVRLIDQFSDPSRQVVKASKDMEKRIGAVAEQFENVGDIMTGAGERMTKGITAPVLAAGATALKFSSDSQDALAQFEAATGASAEEVEKYKDAINNVYSENFGESINDVADGMAKVKQNMQGMDDSALQDVTKYAITLSDTMGYDVAENTRAADTLMKNFGIGAEEAYNLMAQGAQNGLDYSGEMIDTINEYSVQFAKAGLDAEDMFSILAAGAENGAWNLDKVGDAVKEFSVRAVDGSDSTAEGFEKLGMDVDDAAAKFAAGGDSAKEVFDQVIQGLADMEDPVEQNAAGVDLFGTMWEDLGPSVVTSLTDVNGAFDATKSTMDQMMDTKYDTLSSSLSEFGRTLQTDVLNPIGNQLIPYVDTAINKLNEFKTWWDSLGPEMQDKVVKFAMVAAAIGPVLLAVGKLSSGIGGMITNFGKIGGAITRLTGAGGFSGLVSILTGPVGIAIAAVVAGAVLIYQNWDRIGPIVERIANRFSEFWGRVQPVLQPFLDLIGQIATFIGSVFGPIFDGVLKGAGNALVVFFEGAAQIIDNVLGIFEGIITFLDGVFTGDWEKIWQGLCDIVGNIFGLLEGLVKTPINAVIALVNGVIEKINSIQFTVPDWVPIVGGKSWEGLNIPTIPQLAAGTDDWQGGVVQINERGGEIVDLPSGTRVYPHDESVRRAREEGGKKLSVVIAKLADQIVVREDADIDRIARELVKKIAQAAENMG